MASKDAALHLRKLWGRIFKKMFSGGAQCGCEDVMKLCTNGSGAALPKDFF